MKQLLWKIIQWICASVLMAATLALFMVLMFLFWKYILVIVLCGAVFIIGMCKIIDKIDHWGKS